MYESVANDDAALLRPFHTFFCEEWTCMPNRRSRRYSELARGGYRRN